MSEQTKKKRIFEENDGEEMSIDFYQLYLDEIASIPPCTKEEELSLLKAMASGDAAARKRLAEGKLSLAVKIAEEYRDRGLPMGDLVQEANMALLLFLGDLPGSFDGDFDECASTSIRASLEDAVNAQENEHRIEEEMAARVNVLKDISARMAEELGREATVEELAERMKMTVDEIKDIMKLTLDALSIGGDVLPEE